MFKISNYTLITSIVMASTVIAYQDTTDARLCLPSRHTMDPLIIYKQRKEDSSAMLDTPLWIGCRQIRSVSTHARVRGLANAHLWCFSSF